MVFQQFNLVSRLDVLTNVLMGRLSYQQAHGFTQDDTWDIASIAVFFAMSNRLANSASTRPNDEFYLMGRVPKAK